MKRLIWVFKKEGSGVESSEYVGSKKKKGLTFDQFVDSYEKLDPKEKAAFKAKTDKWDKDFTGHSINEIRSAGLSQAEQDANPEKKNILLASQYLQRDPKNPNRFKADFHGNYLAEYKAIGWGNVFPQTVESIKVYNQVGEIICDKAVRAISPNGKEGYYDARGLESKPPRYEYIFMYSGFTAEIIKTITPEEAEVKKKLMQDESKAMQRSSRMRESVLGSQGGFPSIPGAPKKGPGVSIEQNLASLQKESERTTSPIETTETRAGRRRIVDIATKYAGTNRFDTDFQQYPDLQGGKLGCAWVASTILREAGYLNQTIPGVDATKDALLKKGWTASSEQPEPGDVVIWERLPGRQVIKDDGSEAWMPGHKHIGIVVGPNLVVDNDSNPPRGPKAKPLYRPGRGIEAILKPPAEKGKSTEAQVGPNKGSMQAPTATAGENLKPANGIAHHTNEKGSKVSLETMVNDHRQNTPNLKIRPEMSKALERFREKVMRNKARYEQVSQATNVPWYLIAAIHERESGGNFNTYLHNGDPLGKPTVHVPVGKLFYDWETAAIDAINSMGLTQKLGLTPETKDMGLLLTYAERYNGLGYRRPELGTTSPYVYSGTNMYEKGKYVRDGVYDPNAVDKQLGVAAMILALNGPEDYGPTDKNKAVV